MRRLVRSAVILAGATALVASAALTVTGTPAGAASSACPKPPLEVTILPGPVGTTGPTELAVTDAVARRVPIVPHTDTTKTDRTTLDRLEAKAATTDLALFTMYLADFDVPRRDLRGYGFGEVSAPEGKTVAAVTVVPTERAGFRAGDVAEVAPFEYDATTTFSPVSLVVNSSGMLSTYAYDGVEGAVKIRKLTKRSICLDMDVVFTRRGEPVASVVGAVKAKVVKADPTFFYT